MKEREGEREIYIYIWLWVWAFAWRSRLSRGVKACAMVACFGCRMCFCLEVCLTFAVDPWGYGFFGGRMFLGLGVSFAFATFLF